jgi:putative endonuclease
MYKSYYVYIMANTYNTVLYIGITNNLHRRVFEHKENKIKGFTAKYIVNKLVWFAETNNINEALLKEKQLKKWNRSWKVNLIRKENPYFEDLSKEWYDLS